MQMCESHIDSPLLVADPLNGDAHGRQPAHVPPYSQSQERIEESVSGEQFKIRTTSLGVDRWL